MTSLICAWLICSLFDSSSLPEPSAFVDMAPALSVWFRITEKAQLVGCAWVLLLSEMDGLNTKSAALEGCALLMFLFLYLLYQVLRGKLAQTGTLFLLANV